MLRPVFDRTGGKDGRVSIEVDPRIAHETDRTTAEAKALWWLVDRPNLMIKIPATLAGLPAITAATAAGISINVTLIFSIDRYRAVMDAYLAGLEQARSAGIELSTIRSVASFFVSRVDTEIDKRLDKIGTDEAKAVRGKAGIANARLAYEAFEQTFAGDRWASLEADGAHRQRPLWASTGVKDPAYDDTMYVTELVARGRQHHARSDPQRGRRSRPPSPATRSGPSTPDAQAVSRVADLLRDVGTELLDDVVQVLKDAGVDAARGCAEATRRGGREMSELRSERMRAKGTRTP